MYLVALGGNATWRLATETAIVEENVETGFLGEKFRNAGVQ